MKASHSLLPRLAAAALAMFLVTGCSDDDETETPDSGVADSGVPDSGTPDAGEPDSGTSEPPLYAVITQVSVNSQSTSYVVVTDKVDHTDSLNLDNAVEVPGRALGSGISKSGTLYVSSSEGAIVTRYKLTADARLVKDGEVSFADRGVNTIGEYQHQFQYASPTKAYYLDARTSQVIVWNPTAMTVTNAIKLSDLTISGAAATFATMPVHVGTKFIVPIGWRPSSGTGITKQAGVVVIDSSNDTAIVVKDPKERCGYVRDSVLGPDNKVYLATEAYGSAVFRIAPTTTPTPCLLRFDPETNTYDPDFFRELGALTNGKATGSLVEGPDGTAYLRVLDETVYTVVDGTHPRLIASAVAWTFWQLDLTTFTATHVSTLPASTGSSFLFDVEDDKVLFTEFTNNSSVTNVRYLSDQSGNLAFSTQGLMFSFVQLR
ncbi:hypothetical protein LY474_25665 [Myxococcus stipitatus]|uniref:hypothetical protein n=1 Tax=Myxococcus stipitatus TaxID=83455 RepID=UPI001F1DB4FC|nr:hypothetical protein [Myxococcus stipitatus]MCE9671203.1 hypothetical protein [Myxococcus stipitatus]